MTRAPLACAAGLAAIQVTLEEDLPGQAAMKGDFLLRELACLQQQYPQVLKEAHGKGLLIGMEFPVQETGWKVASGLFKRGVLVAGTYSKAQVIRIECLDGRLRADRHERRRVHRAVRRSELAGARGADFVCDGECESAHLLPGDYKTTIASPYE